jgi:hypothetical protein
MCVCAPVYLLSTAGQAFGTELFHYLRTRTRKNYNFDISNHVMQLVYMQAIIW